MSEYADTSEISRPQSDHRMSKMRNIKSEINALMSQIDSRKQIFQLDEVQSKSDNNMFGVESVSDEGVQKTMNFQ